MTPSHPVPTPSRDGVEGLKTTPSPVPGVYTGTGTGSGRGAGRGLTPSPSEPEHFAAVVRKIFPSLEEPTVSRSKQKGTAWETQICLFLAEQGFPHVERRALAGTSDRGDIAGIPGWVIEAKNCQKTELAAWVDEAALEQANDGAEFSAVWHHRRGRGKAGDGFVTMTGATFVRLLRAAGHGSPLSAPHSPQDAAAGGQAGVDA